MSADVQSMITNRHCLYTCTVHWYISTLVQDYKYAIKDYFCTSNRRATIPKTASALATSRRNVICAIVSINTWISCDHESGWPPDLCDRCDSPNSACWQISRVLCGHFQNLKHQSLQKGPRMGKGGGRSYPPSSSWTCERSKFSCDWLTTCLMHHIDLMHHISRDASYVKNLPKTWSKWCIGNPNDALMHQVQQFMENQLHHDAWMIRCINHTVMRRIDASIIPWRGESMHQSYRDAENRCIDHTLVRRINASIIPWCGESMHQSYRDAENRCINHTRKEESR